MLDLSLFTFQSVYLNGRAADLAPLLPGTFTGLRAANPLGRAPPGVSLVLQQDPELLLYLSLVKLSEILK